METYSCIYARGGGLNVRGATAERGKNIICVYVIGLYGWAIIDPRISPWICPFRYITANALRSEQTILLDAHSFLHPFSPSWFTVHFCLALIVESAWTGNLHAFVWTNSLVELHLQWLLCLKTWWWGGQRSFSVPWKHLLYSFGTVSALSWNFLCFINMFLS